MERLDLPDFLLIAEAVTGIDAHELARLPGVAAAEAALAPPSSGLARKAAVLCSQLVRARPLHDGNKRVALLCMIELLRRNGADWAPVADEEERAHTIEALARHELAEEDFVRWVERQVR